MGAARSILELGTKLREAADLERRIGELERAALERSEADGGSAGTIPRRVERLERCGRNGYATRDDLIRMVNERVPRWQDWVRASRE
ncbi:MAG: hypothetical protein HOP29_04295 [Phycisphaerales bacterium]|nr:hypothetical protein [Phycisphaerales bacterium]